MSMFLHQEWDELKEHRLAWENATPEAQPKPEEVEAETPDVNAKKQSEIPQINEGRDRARDGNAVEDPNHVEEIDQAVKAADAVARRAKQGAQNAVAALQQSTEAIPDQATQQVVRQALVSHEEATTSQVPEAAGADVSTATVATTTMGLAKPEVETPNEETSDTSDAKKSPERDEPPGPESEDEAGEGEEDAPEEEVPTDPKKYLSYARNQLSQINQQVQELRSELSKDSSREAELQPQIDALLEEATVIKDSMESAKNVLRSGDLSYGERMKLAIDDVQDVLNDPNADMWEKLGAFIEFFMRMQDGFKQEKIAAKTNTNETQTSVEHNATIQQESDIRKELEESGGTAANLQKKAEDRRDEIKEELNKDPDGLYAQKQDLAVQETTLKTDIDKLESQMGALGSDVDTESTEYTELNTALEDAKEQLEETTIKRGEVDKKITELEKEDKNLQQKIEMIDKMKKDGQETEEEFDVTKKGMIETLDIHGTEHAENLSILLKSTKATFNEDSLKLQLDVTGDGFSRAAKELANSLGLQIPTNEQMGIGTDGSVTDESKLNATIRGLFSAVEKDAAKKDKKEDELEEKK